MRTKKNVVVLEVALVTSLSSHNAFYSLQGSSMGCWLADRTSEERRIIWWSCVLVKLLLLDRKVGILMMLMNDTLPEIIADSLAQEACRINPWQCWLAEHLGLAFLAPVPPTLVPPQGQNIPLFAPLIKAFWPLVQLGQLWWNGIPVPVTPLLHELPFQVMQALGCGAAAKLLLWFLFHYFSQNQNENQDQEAENEDQETEKVNSKSENSS
ncbi:hypothetical protein Pmani_006943 [Petrolisthes manimaculis]|uniref:Uncharacterized protein n=1 Tax=Petrolisthes manimaculis TaxID=1843537 RepID=A0AAE1Q9Y5_9EUCA|nr:hypothetical protein Pmani_006943 [Petrolisthes manimaculis]